MLIFKTAKKLALRRIQVALQVVAYHGQVVHRLEVTWYVVVDYAWCIYACKLIVSDGFVTSGGSTGSDSVSNPPRRLRNSGN